MRIAIDLKVDYKASVLDIKARDQGGRQFNVEMQMLAFGAFRVFELRDRRHQMRFTDQIALHILELTKKDARRAK